MGETLQGLTPETYMAERLEQYKDWYDKKAVSCKSRYLRMRGFSVVAGAVVPVLVNMQSTLTFHNVSIVTPLVTVISLLVVISVSLESVLHYREQWKNYRSTEQQIGREKMLYLAGVGSYKGMPSQDAFRLFVERIEELIGNENAATLSTLTVAAETGQKSASTR